jgi:hypothetical protein
MKHLLFAAPLVLLLAPAASANDDFKAVVRGVESNLGIRRMRVPLLGTMMFCARVVRPGGVKQLDIAIFEDLNYSPPDPERFDAVMRTAVGERWSPMIRVRSLRGEHEWTYIYARPDGRDWKMIIATFEPDEAVIVHLKVKPEALLGSLDEPEHAGQRLSGDGK